MDENRLKIEYKVGTYLDKDMFTQSRAAEELLRKTADELYNKGSGTLEDNEGSKAFLVAVFSRSEEMLKALVHAAETEVETSEGLTKEEALAITRSLF